MEVADDYKNVVGYSEACLIAKGMYFQMGWVVKDMALSK